MTAGAIRARGHLYFRSYSQGIGKFNDVRHLSAQSQALIKSFNGPLAMLWIDIYMFYPLKGGTYETLNRDYPVCPDFPDRLQP